MAITITAILLFASTNIDDIFLLMAWFSQSGNTIQNKHIVAGQFLGFIFILILSLVGAFGALIIPKGWVGILGFLCSLFCIL